MTVEQEEAEEDEKYSQFPDPILHSFIPATSSERYLGNEQVHSNRLLNLSWQFHNLDYICSWHCYVRMFRVCEPVRESCSAAENSPNWSVT